MVNVILAHAYLFLIPLAILEGPLLAIACGVGAGLGLFNPYIAYGILIGGDLAPDLMYYAIGRWGATLPFVRRFASRIETIRENFLALEELWRTRPLPTMASAKLAYLMSPALIVSAGLSGVPLRRFVVCSLLVSTIYLGALAALGFGLARAYGLANLSIQNAAPYVALGGIVVFASFMYATGLMRRRLSNQARRESNLILPQSERP